MSVTRKDAGIQVPQQGTHSSFPRRPPASHGEWLTDIRCPRTGTLSFSVNGVSQGDAFRGLPAGRTYWPAVGVHAAGLRLWVHFFGLTRTAAKGAN